MELKMGLKKLIDIKKNIIIFEDTELSNRIEIDKTKVDVGLFLELLGDYSEEIIVISKNDNRIEIFEEAINQNVTIDFVSTSNLRNRGFDVSIFENKVVLFVKCFDGMTSENNNTFLNVKAISNICKKIILVDAIGENFLYANYFPSLLKFLDVEHEFDSSNVSKETLDSLLLENFTILKNQEIVTSINKNYWFGLSNTYDASINLGLVGFDVSNKMKSNHSHDNSLNKRQTIHGLDLGRKSGVYLNKTLYVLLAVFLGGIGAHKFYARKFVLGLVYMIFAWTYIPIIVSIIEGIRAIGLPQTDDGKIKI